MRLTPTMASLRLLVLRFVRDYVSAWGASPSYGEIAAALETNRTRVRKAVKSLAGDGLLLRTPGPRGLALPDNLAEAVRLLGALGYAVRPIAYQAVTNTPLPDDFVLDYFAPSTSDGALSRGEEFQGRDGGGADNRGAAAGSA